MKKITSKKVLVCYGGKSTEHDISIITALTIFQKYKIAGLDVELAYMTRDGDFYIGENLGNFKTYKKNCLTAEEKRLSNEELRNKYDSLISQSKNEKRLFYWKNRDIMII